MTLARLDSKIQTTSPESQIGDLYHLLESYSNDRVTRAESGGYAASVNEHHHKGVFNFAPLNNFIV